MKVEKIASFVTDRAPSQLELFGPYVMWSTLPEGDLKSQIWLHDLRASSTRSIVTAEDESATIDWAKGSGTRIVYVEQDFHSDNVHDAEGDGEGGPWKVIVFDIDSGKKTLLGRSRTKVEEEFIPSPEIEGDWVVDGSPTNNQGRYSIVANNLQDGGSEVLLRDGDFANVKVTVNTLLYTTPGQDKKIQLRAIDLPKSESRLLAEGSIGFVRSANEGWVGWEERVVEASDEDKSQYAMRVDAKKPPIQITAEGNYSEYGSNVVVGDGIAIWWDGGPEIGPRFVAAATLTPRVLRASIDKRTDGEHLLIHVPSRLAAHGQSVAWAVYESDYIKAPNRVRINVAKLTRG